METSVPGRIKIYRNFEYPKGTQKKSSHEYDDMHKGSKAFQLYMQLVIFCVLYAENARKYIREQDEVYELLIYSCLRRSKHGFANLSGS